MKTKFNKKNIAISLLSVTALAAMPFAFANSASNNKTFDNKATFEKLVNHDDGLSPKLLKMGLNAFHYAKEQGRVHRNVLTIINLSKDSKYKRLWVINLNTDKVEAHTLVANGKNSGLYRGIHFSNRPGSLESSLGVYVTGEPFYGNDANSMRLYGLEKGINNNAYRRDVVMHSAWYVSPSFAKEYGRVGRSWGCFALYKGIAPKVVHDVKGGSVIFAYGPSENHDPAVDSGTANLK